MLTDYPQLAPDRLTARSGRVIIKTPWLAITAPRGWSPWQCRAIDRIGLACGTASTTERAQVKHHLVFAAVVAASFVCPLAAHAQGIPDGVTHGAYVGTETAGPIGAVVGGAVGGVIGGVDGLLGIYPVAPPSPVYRRRNYIRHSYHYYRHRHTAG
jgi:hypothetical protein